MFNIAVIGAGVIGLTSATQIQKQIPNAKITIFAEKLSPGTTGDVSAGFWTPYLVEDTPEHDIIRWSKGTHDYLHRLWRDGFAHEVGICLQPALRLFTEECDIKTTKWFTVPYGSSYLGAKQVAKINELYGTNYSAAAHYITYSCEPSKLLPFLMRNFIKNGGIFVQKRVTSFDEIATNFDVLVNCAGLEARKLTQDAHVQPIRGQVSRVQAPWQYQVVIDESDDGFYIIPNSDCVILGGTHQVGDENMSVCSKDKNRIVEGCAALAPGLKNCVQYEDAVGLRPGRNKVRLEIEQMNLNGKMAAVVHNYGHGGAGVTLSVGCAENACDLVKSVLGINKYQSHL